MRSIAYYLVPLTLFYSLCVSAADNWAELTTIKGTVASVTSDELIVETKDAKRGVMTYPLVKVARHIQVDGKILIKLEKKRDLAALEKYARIQPRDLPVGARVEVFWHDTRLEKGGRLTQNLDYFQVRLLKPLDEDAD